MKKTLLLFAIGALLAGTAQAQVKQTRSVGTFNAVEAGGGIDVILTPGNTAAVVVEADAKAQPQLLTTVSNGRLQIRWEKSFGFGDNSYKRNAHVYVTCPPLKALAFSGGTSAHTTGTLSANALDLSVSGGASAKLALKATKLTSSISSGSTATLTGQADQQHATVSSGAGYHAFALQSSQAEAEASSGATAEVAVSGELSAAASSGGSVRYKGAARVLKSQSSSGGSVSKAN
ncbi:head GIN domain-containing protein [Hymenobacter sp. ASUV-10]|uniref:Head GIN domain-containing protein n=1 Tax=Hymenobacter aranciens TaxID=3063996 RepID=A0ABT9BAM0_9BACT|nr:head GIN domain-containing protein [Hymenobacter sp. ASUV-10]MDO7875317.1 head GIN domain-containing protein [Hymenobacter sp. ASUV-10]